MAAQYCHGGFTPGLQNRGMQGGGRRAEKKGMRRSADREEKKRHTETNTKLQNRNECC